MTVTYKQFIIDDCYLKAFYFWWLHFKTRFFLQYFKTQFHPVTVFEGPSLKTITYWKCYLLFSSAGSWSSPRWPETWGQAQVCLKMESGRMAGFFQQPSSFTSKDYWMGVTQSIANKKLYAMRSNIKQGLFHQFKGMYINTTSVY